jgi:hypothetical protein
VYPPHVGQCPAEGVFVGRPRSASSPKRGMQAEWAVPPKSFRDKRRTLRQPSHIATRKARARPQRRTERQASEPGSSFRLARAACATPVRRTAAWSENALCTARQPSPRGSNFRPASFSKASNGRARRAADVWAELIRLSFGCSLLHRSAAAPPLNPLRKFGSEFSMTGIGTKSDSTFSLQPHFGNHSCRPVNLKYLSLICSMPGVGAWPLR